MLYYCLCFPFFSGKKTWLICSYKSLLHHCQKHTEETERASQKSISSACWPILACSAYKSGSADPFFGGCGEHFRCILKQLGLPLREPILMSINFSASAVSVSSPLRAEIATLALNAVVWLQRDLLMSLGAIFLFSEHHNENKHARNRDRSTYPRRCIPRIANKSQRGHYRCE